MVKPILIRELDFDHLIARGAFRVWNIVYSKWRTECLEVKFYEFVQVNAEKDEIKPKMYVILMDIRRL